MITAIGVFRRRVDSGPKVRAEGISSSHVNDEFSGIRKIDDSGYRGLVDYRYSTHIQQPAMRVLSECSDGCQSL